MNNIIDKKYPYLSGCKDYSILEKAFSEEMLDEIEEAIKLYEDTDLLVFDDETGELYHREGKEYFHSAVAWYASLIDTESFISDFSDKNKQTFKIPVLYQSWGTVEVEATSLAEAIKYAEKNIKDLPLPDEPEYVEDSYIIDYEGVNLVNKESISTFSLSDKIQAAEDKSSKSQSISLDKELDL